MKRLCFDTESNFFDRRGDRFDCAVVYDEERDHYQEFSKTEVNHLVAVLATAGELISHSGTHHDLHVLEVICGKDHVAPLRQIMHHDLYDLCHWQSLENLAKKLVPDLFEICENQRNLRDHAADIRWPKKVRGADFWHSDEWFVETKLAKCRRDVELTYAVFWARRNIENPDWQCY